MSHPVLQLSSSLKGFEGEIYIGYIMTIFFSTQKVYEEKNVEYANRW